VATARARGVLVHLPSRSVNGGTAVENPVEEYPAGDGWRLDEYQDGVWLTVLDVRGRQVATFRPKSYERPEAGRMSDG
jgi:hypothetical protein